MKIQFSLSNSQQVQIENIQQISNQLNEIESQLEYETNKLGQYDLAHKKLNDDFYEVSQHLKNQKEQGLKM
jgi:hypothetical protein